VVALLAVRDDAVAARRASAIPVAAVAIDEVVVITFLAGIDDAVAAPARLEGADVAARALWPRHAALVRRLARRAPATRRSRVACIDRGAPDEQRMRRRRSAVGCERGQMRIHGEDITRRVATDGASGRVLDEVESLRRHRPLAIHHDVAREDG